MDGFDDEDDDDIDIIKEEDDEDEKVKKIKKEQNLKSGPPDNGEGNTTQGNQSVSDA